MLAPLQTYNSVIDACRAAYAWRRALLVFSELVDARVEPTTMTYELVHDVSASASRAASGADPGGTAAQVCRRAPLDDSPKVYEAMRAAGVPQDIAFSAAKQAATNE